MYKPFSTHLLSPKWLQPATGGRPGGRQAACCVIHYKTHRTRRLGGHTAMHTRAKRTACSSFGVFVFFLSDDIQHTGYPVSVLILHTTQSSYREIYKLSDHKTTTRRRYKLYYFVPGSICCLVLLAAAILYSVYIHTIPGNNMLLLLFQLLFNSQLLPSTAVRKTLLHPAARTSQATATQRGGDDADDRRRGAWCYSGRRWYPTKLQTTRYTIPGNKYLVRPTWRFDIYLACIRSYISSEIRCRCPPPPRRFLAATPNLHGNLF